MARKLERFDPVKIRELRQARGVSQAEFGRTIGVAEQTVRKWELGKQDPSIKTLEKVAEELGTFPSYFFTEVTN